MRIGFALGLLLAFVAGCVVTFLIMRSHTVSPAPVAKVQARTQYALDGFCPVTLTDETRWARGNQDQLAEYDGQTFLMASAAAKRKFLADPDRYAPCNRGCDIVAQHHAGQLLRGERSHGLVYRGQIYLFASEANLERFTSAPDRYLKSNRGDVQPANYVEVVKD